MRVLLTASEAIEKSIWHDLCEYKGINKRALNEGLMKGTEEIELSEDEARKFGLVR
ncbi:hypothetical protein [Paenibacillus sp. FSL L8-0709]|uniref:hypothetical protein n=1 Tax=Paenibacillus sp. FSL L8-0709 TaxID=2975312 RepID=UPI0030FB554E